MKIKILIGLFVLLFLVFGISVFNSWRYSIQIQDIYSKNTFDQNELNLVIKNKKMLRSEYICKDNSAPYVAINQNTLLPLINISKARYENNRLFVENYELVYQGKSIESYLAFLAFEESKNYSEEGTAKKILPVFLIVSEYSGGMSEKGCLLPIKN